MGEKRTYTVIVREDETGKEWKKENAEGVLAFVGSAYEDSKHLRNVTEVMFGKMASEDIANSILTDIFFDDVKPEIFKLLEGDAVEESDNERAEYALFMISILARVAQGMGLNAKDIAGFTGAISQTEAWAMNQIDKLGLGEEEAEEAENEGEGDSSGSDDSDGFDRGAWG